MTFLFFNTYMVCWHRIPNVSNKTQLHHIVTPSFAVYWTTFHFLHKSDLIWIAANIFGNCFVRTAITCNEFCLKLPIYATRMTIPEFSIGLVPLKVACVFQVWKSSLSLTSRRARTALSYYSFSIVFELTYLLKYAFILSFLPAMVISAQKVSL